LNLRSLRVSRVSGTVVGVTVQTLELEVLRLEVLAQNIQHGRELDSNRHVSYAVMREKSSVREGRSDTFSEISRNDDM
jgi:hypothetical protein